ncbi:MAG TPA: hypothetical protein VK031_10215 [Tissierellaceae bacterium]|nr:hypothetical protein [Tissierellaceae bacterium]
MFYAFFINGIAALVIEAVMASILVDFGLGYDRVGMLLSIQSVENLVASFMEG